MRSYFLKVLKLIAEYLKKDNPNSYTGHSFQRTAAIWIANLGVGNVELKKWERRSSDKIAAGYVSRSKPMKRNIATILLDKKDNNNKIIKSVLNNQTKKSLCKINENLGENKENNILIDNNNNSIKNIIGNITVHGGTINININKN